MNNLDAHLLLLALAYNIELANQAAVQIYGPEAAGTFNENNYVLREGGDRYAIAGVYVDAVEYAQIAALEADLEGHVVLLKEYLNGVWQDVESPARWLDANGFTRPEEDEHEG